MNSRDQFSDLLDALSDRLSIDSLRGPLVASYVGYSRMIRLSLVVEARVSRQLSPLKEFCLKFIEGGVGDETALAGELGVDDGCVRRVVQTLLLQDQVSLAPAPGGGAILALTTRGLSDLKEHREEHWVRDNFIVDYDPVKEIFQNKTNARFVSGQELKLPRALLLPSPDTQFDLSGLNDKGARAELLACLNRRRDDGTKAAQSVVFFESLRVVDIATQEHVFKPVPVLIYSSQAGSGLEPIIYGSWVGSVDDRLFDHEELVNSEIVTGNLRLPDEGTVPRVRPRPTVPIDLGLVAKREQKLQSALQEVEKKKNLIENLQEEGPVDPKDPALLKAQEGLSRAQEEANRASVVKQAADGRPVLRILQTKEHRSLLERCFTEARSSIFIISPWLRADAVNTFLLSRIKGCLDRGVLLGIGYGIDDATDEMTNQVVAKLETFVSQGSFFLKNVGSSHEKILICDSRYAVVTSFNWLSFRPNDRRGLRRETGIYIEDPIVIAQLQDTARNLIGIPTTRG